MKNLSLGLLVSLCFACLLNGCAKSPAVAYQNSTIDALLDGNYDGEVTFADLKQRGDFGIGTFNELDGEMVALDGEFWQARSDGSVSRVPPGMKTPFSVVTFFKPDRFLPIVDASRYEVVQQRIDGMRQSAGRAHAFAVRGLFSSVRVRSVPRQTQPYARLAQVVRAQSLFDRKNVRGTLVGFWFPESMRHANVPGYHFHFISDDRSFGGHVLQCSIAEAKAASQELKELHIAMPSRAPTTGPAVSHDELEKVEK